MKNYFIRAIVSAVAYTIVYLLLDIVFGNMHSFREYAIQAICFGVVKASDASFFDFIKQRIIPTSKDNKINLITVNIVYDFIFFFI